MNSKLKKLLSIVTIFGTLLVVFLLRTNMISAKTEKESLPATRAVETYNLVVRSVDDTGTVIPNAEVRLTEESGKVTTLTGGSQGRVTFSNVPIGNHEVAVNNPNASAYQYNNRESKFSIRGGGKLRASFVGVRSSEESNPEAGIVYMDYMSPRYTTTPMQFTLSGISAGATLNVENNQTGKITKVKVSGETSEAGYLEPGEYTATYDYESFIHERNYYFPEYTYQIQVSEERGKTMITSTDDPNNKFTGISLGFIWLETKLVERAIPLEAFDVTIRNTDGINAISDSLFSLYVKGEKLAEQTTNSEGKTTFSGLLPGDYFFEWEGSSEYVADYRDYHFTIAENGEIISDEQRIMNKASSLENREASFDFITEKKPQETGNGALILVSTGNDGAVLRTKYKVTETNGTEFGIIDTTDSEGIGAVIGLDFGKSYKIQIMPEAWMHETDYIMNNSVYNVTVNDKGVVSVDSEDSTMLWINNQILSVRHQKRDTPLPVNKYNLTITNKEKDKVIPNSSFSLIYQTFEIAEGVTGADGKVSFPELEPGDYKVKWSNSSSEYPEDNTEHAFKILEDGNITTSSDKIKDIAFDSQNKTNSFTFSNDKTVRKTLYLGSATDSFFELPGMADGLLATYEVWNEEEREEVEYTGLNEHGEATVRVDLEVDKTYQIKVIPTTWHYQETHTINDSIYKVTMREDGSADIEGDESRAIFLDKTLVIQHQVKKYKLTILNTDGEDSIVDSKFTLTSVALMGGYFPMVYTGTTDAQGKLLLADVHYGEYVLKWENTSGSYKEDNNEYLVTIEPNGNITATATNKITDIVYNSVTQVNSFTFLSEKIVRKELHLGSATDSLFELPGTEEGLLATYEVWNDEERKEVEYTGLNEHGETTVRVDLEVDKTYQIKVIPTTWHYQETHNINDSIYKVTMREDGSADIEGDESRAIFLDKTLVIQHQVKKYGLTIFNTDGEDSIVDSKFTLTSVALMGGYFPMVYTGTTDSQGKVLLADVHYGEYILKWENTSGSYKEDDNEYLITIEPNGNITATATNKITDIAYNSVTQVNSFTFLSEKKPAMPIIQFSSISSLTGSLPGTFSVVKDGGTATIIAAHDYSGSGHEKSFTAEAGEYTLQMDTTGWTYSNHKQNTQTYIFSVNDLGEIALKSDQGDFIQLLEDLQNHTATIQVKHQALMNLRVTNTDGTNPIKNSTMNLQLGQEKWAYTTDENGDVIYENLTPDNYIIWWDNSSGFYLANDSDHFIKINANGTVEITSSNALELGGSADPFELHLIFISKNANNLALKSVPDFDFSMNNDWDDGVYTGKTPSEQITVHDSRNNASGGGNWRLTGQLSPLTNTTTSESVTNVILKFKGTTAAKNSSGDLVLEPSLPVSPEISQLAANGSSEVLMTAKQLSASRTWVRSIEFSELIAPRQYGSSIGIYSGSLTWTLDDAP